MRRPTDVTRGVLGGGCFVRDFERHPFAQWPWQRRHRRPHPTQPTRMGSALPSPVSRRYNNLPASAYVCVCVCDTSPHHVVEVVVVVVRRRGGINERAVVAANYCETAARRPTTGNGRISRSKFDKSFPSPSIALCNAPFNAPCSPVTPLLLVIAWYCTVLPLRSEQPPQSPHTRRNKLLLSTRRRSVRGRGCDFEVQWIQYVNFLSSRSSPYCQFSVCSSWRWKSRTLGPSAGLKRREKEGVGRVGVGVCVRKKKPYRWITNRLVLGGFKSLIAGDSAWVRWAAIPVQPFLDCLLIKIQQRSEVFFARVTFATHKTQQVT